MLNEIQLQALLADLESDSCERTESTTNTDKFGQAICAFANDLPNHRRPGYLLIGVKDDGSLAGIKVTDDLLKNLAGIRSDGNILPQPMMTVTKFSLTGGDVAVVEVQPSDLPPVRYKGRVHIRVGPRKAIANEQEERVLSERRVALAKSFDAQPCLEAKIDDLALGQFDAYRREAVDAETIAANHRPLEQQLASLRLYDPDRGCATHAGLLLVGKNPRFFLPGAYVQYLELPGTSLTELPVDQAEVAGDLQSVLKELLGRLRLLVKTAMVQVNPFAGKAGAQLPGRRDSRAADERGDAPQLQQQFADPLLRILRSHRDSKPRRPVWRGNTCQLPHPQQLPQSGDCRGAEIVGLCEPFRLRCAAGPGAADGERKPTC